jgi:hypothetical protein
MILLLFSGVGEEIIVVIDTTLPALQGAVTFNVTPLEWVVSAGGGWSVSDSGEWPSEQAPAWAVSSGAGWGAGEGSEWS